MSTRKQREALREKCGCRDPEWVLYTHEGPTLEEILAVKPVRHRTEYNGILPKQRAVTSIWRNNKYGVLNGKLPFSPFGPVNVWTQEKGWHRDEVPRYTRSHGRHNREVSKQGGPAV